MKEAFPNTIDNSRFMYAVRLYASTLYAVECSLVVFDTINSFMLIEIVVGWSFFILHIVFGLLNFNTLVCILLLPRKLILFLFLCCDSIFHLFW